MIIKDEFLKFYDAMKSLYLEIDTSKVGPTGSLHRDKAPDNNILRPITFAHKILSVAEIRYSNIQIETLGILYGLKIFSNIVLPKR